jgi:D-Tyr-tRNAtyr deacylase
MKKSEKKEFVGTSRKKDEDNDEKIKLLEKKLIKYRIENGDEAGKFQKTINVLNN